MFQNVMQLFIPQPLHFRPFETFLDVHTLTYSYNPNIDPNYHLLVIDMLGHHSTLTTNHLIIYDVENGPPVVILPGISYNFHTYVTITNVFTPYGLIATNDITRLRKHSDQALYQMGRTMELRAYFEQVHDVIIEHLDTLRQSATILMTNRTLDQRIGGYRFFTPYVTTVDKNDDHIHYRFQPPRTLFLVTTLRHRNVLTDDLLAYDHDIRESAHHPIVNTKPF